jgi:DNA polymerase II small subunit/DNA polymerase delta subunit B
VTASTQEVAQVEKFGGVGALVERLQRGCSGQQSVNVLQDTLSWGHICPTSPGNRSCACTSVQRCCCFARR